ncbi:MAG: YfhD-like protein [Paenibacillus sp.]|jgi:hypothetical protein|nr:YfhD-like protein [Paenibacillus sp.]
MTEQQKQQRESQQRLPIGKNEDVDYSAEMADEDDLEAVERANQADARQEQSER